MSLCNLGKEVKRRSSQQKSLLIWAQYLERFDHKSLVIIITALLVMIHLGVSLIRFTRDSDLLAFRGSASYSQIAENILDKGLYSLDGIHPTAYRPPLYPLFLTGVMAMFRDNFRLAAILLQLALNIGCGILIFFVALRIFNHRVGAFISVALYALHYTFHIESTYQRETILFTFLLLLFSYFLTESHKSSLTYLALSCLAALAYLTRSAGIFLFLLIFLELIHQDHQHKGCLLKHLGLISVVALGVIAPWQIYVYRNFHTFSFLPSSNGGWTLYFTNNPDFRSYYPYVFVEYYEPFIYDMLDKQGIEVTDEVAADKYLGDEARKFILQNPLGFIENGILKLVIFYTPLFPLGDGQLVGEPGNLTLQNFRFSFPLAKIAQSLLLLLIIGGLVLFVKDRALYTGQQKFYVLLMIVFVLLLTMIHMTLSEGEYRYRLPLDPWFILLAGLGYSNLLRQNIAFGSVEI